MAREIKFRAWDKVQKEWIHNDVFLSLVNGIIFEGKVHQEERVDIQMYTELKDKNGKEIYEGDIVKFYSPREKGANASDLVLEIAWKEHGFWGKYIREDNENVGNIMAGGLQRMASGEYTNKEKEWYFLDREIDMGVLSHATSFEVIGNIYENPELLKV